MISWPDNPTYEDLNNALKKGFGRAYLWASNGRMNQEALLEACLNDYRYDTQVEDTRGDWLWQLLKAASLEQEFQEQIFTAFKDIDESKAQSQLCQLARHFALSGDERFRAQLRRIVTEKPVDDSPWLGEEELIRLDGAEGFILAVSQHGAELASREPDWFDRSLGDEGVEWLGEECVVELLSTAAANNREVHRFQEAWEEQKKQWENREQVSHRERVGKYKVEEVITAAESTEKTSVRFRGWGMYASDIDIDAIFQRMIANRDVEALRRYLIVFSRRSLPVFDSRFLEFCNHSDENIRRRAAYAIANNCHPEVRQFALERLSQPGFQEFAIAMLAKNYELADESLVLDHLVLAENECELHSTLMSLRNLIEEKTQAKCKQAVELVYDNTPCSSCRHSVVELLNEREELPESMQTECQFDVEIDTRQLVQGPIWNE